MSEYTPHAAKLLSQSHAHSLAVSFLLFSFSALFSTLRDAVHVYIAIAPVYRGSDLEGVPHLSMLLHNDCRFLAAHLARLHATLAMQQQSHPIDTLPPSSRPPLVLVDLCAPLRSLGAKYLTLHVGRMRAALGELSDLLRSFFESDAEDETLHHSCVLATRQAMHELHALEKTWSRLMGDGHAHASAARGAEASDAPLLVPASSPRSGGWSLTLGLLLESLSSRLLSLVLDRSDLSVSAASRVHALLDLLGASWPSLDARHVPPSWPALMAVRNIMHPDQNLGQNARMRIARMLQDNTQQEPNSHRSLSSLFALCSQALDCLLSR